MMTESTPKTIALNSVFTSFEGEGLDAGIPTLFVRVQGCSVGCKWCDTKEAISKVGANKKLVAISQQASDIVSQLNSSKINRVSITGGNPVEQRESVKALVEEITTQMSKSILDRKITFHLEHPGFFTTPGISEGEASLVAPKLEFLGIFDSICFDFKTPSSGVKFKFGSASTEETRNLSLLTVLTYSFNKRRKKSQRLSVKAVIKDSDDTDSFYDAIKSALNFAKLAKAEGHNINLSLLVSPMHDMKTNSFSAPETYKRLFELNDECITFFGNPIRVSVQTHKLLGFE